MIDLKELERTEQQKNQCIFYPSLKGFLDIVTRKILVQLEYFGLIHKLQISLEDTVYFNN